MNQSPAIRWGLIGAVISVVVLGILLLFEAPSAPPQTKEKPVIDLIGPAPLQDASEVGQGMTDPDMAVSLPEGGWLQVAGDDGQLSQQYRFSHLDPDPPAMPDNWIAMQDLVVEMFMHGGRLITLEGDRAVAYAPRRALEEGRLIGNVVIRMFESVGGTWPDPAKSTPSMTVNTTAAAFDNLSGRITCESDVKIVTSTEEMKGEDLQILLNDRDDRIEYLRFEKVDYLLIRELQGSDQPVVSHRHVHPAIAKSSGTRIIPVKQSAPPPKDVPFYVLTMEQDVRIVQSPPADAADPRLGRVATADLLTVFFSLEADAFDTQEPPPPATSMGGTGLLVAMAMGAAPPIPAPEEILVTCSGPMEMVPLEDDSLRPPTPQDVRLELSGAPVEVRDLSQNLSVTCGLLTWRTQMERVDLTRADMRHVIITTDDLRLESDAVWARPDHGEAGIDAEGMAVLSPTDGGSEETTITWQQKVKIAFDPATEQQDQGMRSIRFMKDVEVKDESGNISTDDLTMRFKRDPQGASRPSRLIARRGVRAANAQQVLWSDQLEASIEPAADADSTEDTQKLDVRSFAAEGGVQVRMADGGRVWAERMEGDAQQEIIDLTGSDVTIARRDVIIGHGKHLRVERLAGTADWDGSGRAMLLGTPIDVTADQPIDRPALPSTPGPDDTQIDWNNGVHITFDPDDQGQDVLLKSINFHEDVVVQSPDGSISAGELSMTFVPDDSGEARPDQLVCRTRVHARNDQQSLWADQLVAGLDTADEKPAEDSPQQGGLHSDNIIVRDFDATGNVQVLTADGARAFAQRLQGDAQQEVARLTGDDVLIARSDVVIDRGNDLRLDRHAGTADWIGPGRSRMLATPIDISANNRIPPPRIVGQDGGPTVTMRTTWTESMHYDSTFANGAGALDITGNVESVVDRSDTERSSLKGDTLRLEFARVVGGSTETQTPTNDSDAIDPFGSGDRVLELLIARGQARLESRTWPTAERTALPRVFYVGAMHLTWNDLRSEAKIVGDGDLIIREPNWEQKQRTGDGPFSGPGTSRFTWSQNLDLTREQDDRFRITMTGDVQGRWKSAIDRRDIATITAQYVEVLTRRGEESLTLEADAPLDMGSDMEVDQLRARERVYLATPTRRVDCHQVDYNSRTRIAELSSRPGRTVSLITEGSPMPVQATQMVWNMDPDVDTITLERPRGSGIP
ncbi:MAG: hypothetical protein MK077_04085 [Phycisphaerales bacterium]|nr:hypothetical protein [Phycisphaerales bacterium]